jgi:hypothetical protein
VIITEKIERGSTYPFSKVSEIVDVIVRAKHQKMHDLKRNPSILGRQVLYGFVHQEIHIFLQLHKAPLKF